jgi:hypothetical protein
MAEVAWAPRGPRSERPRARASRVDHPVDHPDDPTGAVWSDDPSNVSRPDRSGADQIDAEHQATDLAVGGSNPSRRATITAAQRPCSRVAACCGAAGLRPNCDPVGGHSQHSWCGAELDAVLGTLTAAGQGLMHVRWVCRCPARRANRPVLPQPLPDTAAVAVRHAVQFPTPADTPPPPAPHGRRRATEPHRRDGGRGLDASRRRWPQASRTVRRPRSWRGAGHRRARKRLDLLAVAADPYRWAAAGAADGEGIPVGEFPQSPARMGRHQPVRRSRGRPAAVPRRHKRAGPPRRQRRAQQDSRGVRLAKEHKDSKRRIDAAVAAVMAHLHSRKG